MQLDRKGHYFGKIELCIFLMWKVLVKNAQSKIYFKSEVISTQENSNKSPTRHSDYTVMV